MNHHSPTVGFLIGEVSRLMRRAFERLCADGSLTLAQARTLLYLSRNEGINQAELADLLEVQPMTLARQIDQLEQLAIVERRADPNDRRAYRLYLLPAAATDLQTIREVGETLRAKAFKGMNADQIAALMDGLLVMRANLSASDEPGDGKP
jgi:DNA-binding MarR family transcriptional regulator